MLVNAELYVKDLPGQLVGSLEPVSMVDGNIVGVVHNREKIVNNRICINITFEVDTAERLCELKDIWKSKDIIISRIGSVYQTYTMNYLLIGKLEAGFIDGVMAEAAKEIVLDGMDVRYMSKSTASSKRTGMISVKTRSEDDLVKLDSFLREACRKAEVTYVRGI